MDERHYKIARYIIAGGTSAGTSITILFLLTHFAHVWYLLSAIVANIAAYMISFSLQKFWTFRNHSMDALKKQAFHFLIIFIINIITNTAFLYFLVEYAHIHYLISQIVSGIILAFINFFVYKYHVFAEATPI